MRIQESRSIQFLLLRFSRRDALPRMLVLLQGIHSETTLAATGSFTELAVDSKAQLCDL